MTALIRRFLLLLWLCCTLAAAQVVPNTTPLPTPPADVQDGLSFRVVAFHDIRHRVKDSFAQWPEATALDENTLTEYFAWLRKADYRPVTLQQIIDARAGGKPLPPRAVLLTFDDGYESFYSKVFPLLRRFNYPAVMALVSSWLEVPADQPVTAYGGEKPPMREAFLTWAQAREMAQSGLVELASHSHAMHRGVPANPQGNTQPAAVTHQYNPATGRYEDDAQWRARVESDLRRSRELIEARTGQRVRSLVWPYGAYNAFTLDMSARAGMPYTMTLDAGPNAADVPLAAMRRGLALYDLEMPAYPLMRSPARPDRRSLMRAMHVDLDNVYDADPARQDLNLSRLLDRVQAIGPSAVYLQAYADPDGNGAADALYFPNRALPMRADLFNRVAWQLRTRTNVEVYAWMPVLAFELPAGHPLAGERVQFQQPAKPLAASQTRYPRLTPFDPRVRELIAGIYEDLGRNAPIDGVLFHDDATLSDDEDVSPAALAAYRAQGLPGDVAAIKQNPAAAQRWRDYKTRFLTDFTLDLAKRLRDWQPRVLTARNIYAPVLMQPESEDWFAQNYTQSLAAYDHTAVMAMPLMEQVKDPAAWLGEMVKRVQQTPGGLERTVFELQARDWRTRQPVPDETLGNWWAVLHRQGARHMAYYPDDFLNAQPGLVTARRLVSVRQYLRGIFVPQPAPPEPRRPALTQPETTAR